jgi:hypothetical protein
MSNSKLLLASGRFQGLLHIINKQAMRIYIQSFIKTEQNNLEL